MRDDSPALPDTLQLRPLTLQDAPRCTEFVAGLSFGTRYFRFGRGDFVPPANWLSHECRDDAGVWHVIALSGTDGPIVGSARGFSDQHGDFQVEIVVADAWQGRGLATRLLLHIAEAARTAGFVGLVLEVLPTNRRMLRFAEREGFVAMPATPGDALRRLRRPLSD